MKGIERGRRQAGGERWGGERRVARKRRQRGGERNKCESIIPFELLVSAMPEVIIIWTSPSYRLFISESLNSVFVTCKDKKKKTQRKCISKLKSRLELLKSS